MFNFTYICFHQEVSSNPEKGSVLHCMKQEDNKGRWADFEAD